MSRKISGFRIAAGAIVLVVSAFPARAAVITDSAAFSTVLSQGFQQFGVDEDLALDLFDPSLGTLQSVSLLLKTSLTGQHLMRSVVCGDSNPACHVDGEAQVSTDDHFQLELGSGSSDWVFVDGVRDNSPRLLCEGTGVCIAQGQLPDVNNTYTRLFVAPVDLGLFQGPGAFTLNYELGGTSCYGGALFSPGGSTTCNYLGVLSVTAEITYTFDPVTDPVTPPTGVPEPRTALLLVGGLGFVALGRRRRARA